MKRIVVVEDEQMLAKIIEIKLQEESYQVELAHDGEAAYTLLSQPNLPDLVLMDVLLPKMTGFEVLEKLKAENKPMPKVVMFSNFAQQADIERAHSLGVVDYIMKAAFSPAEILAKIKSLFAAEEAGATSTPEQQASYSNFNSLQDVMPMSEVLHPGESNNNP